MSYVYHTLTPKAHKCPVSSLQARLPISLKHGAFNLSMAAEEHPAAKHFHLNCAGGCLDHPSCAGGCLDWFSHTGGCSEYPSGAGGCSDWPLHLCMPAASNPWALKHTQNRILYITWKVSSSGCNTHERNNPMGWRIFLSGAHTKEYLPLCPPSTAPQSHFKQGMRSSKITVSIARLHSNPVNNDMSGLSQLSASISLVHAEQDQPSPRATWVLAPTDTHGCLHMPR